MVDNLRCEDCAKVIKKALRKIEGVTCVEVYTENGEVDVICNENTNLNLVYERLNSIGYPLSGIEQGSLERIISSIKSRINCTLSRFSKDQKDDKSQDPK